MRRRDLPDIIRGAYAEGFGGGTRTPDTRIMIPRVAARYRAVRRAICGMGRRRGNECGHTCHRSSTKVRRARCQIGLAPADAGSSAGGGGGGGDDEARSSKPRVAGSSPAGGAYGVACGRTFSPQVALFAGGSGAHQSASSRELRRLRQRSWSHRAVGTWTAGRIPSGGSQGLDAGFQASSGSLRAADGGHGGELVRLGGWKS